MTDALGSGRKPLASGPATAEFEDFVAQYDGAADWSEAVAAFGEYLHEGIGLDPGAEIAARIERCVTDGRPAAFIRLGDGEGNLLALANDEYSALANYCVRNLSRLHFGSAEVLIRAAPELLPAFATAIKGANLIGIPGPFGGPMLLKRPDARTYARPIHGLASVHRYLSRLADTIELASKTGAPAGFHRWLLPHYEQLVRGRSIGIVTCRAELRDGLRARMGARDVDLRLVPAQAAIASDPGADTRHFPDRYRELTSELARIEPRGLWFVAAGILGKIYCELIRAAGGIAVDIGHTADIWAGVQSRLSITSKTLATWRIA